jgi:hypothetical protein
MSVSSSINIQIYQCMNLNMNQHQNLNLNPLNLPRLQIHWQIITRGPTPMSSQVFMNMEMDLVSRDVISLQMDTSHSLRQQSLQGHLSQYNGLSVVAPSEEAVPVINQTSFLFFAASAPYSKGLLDQALNREIHHTITGPQGLLGDCNQENSTVETAMLEALFAPPVDSSREMLMAHSPCLIQRTLMSRPSVKTAGPSHGSKIFQQPSS